MPASGTQLPVGEEGAFEGRQEASAPLSRHTVKGCVWMGL